MEKLEIIQREFITLCNELTEIFKNITDDSASNILKGVRLVSNVATWADKIQEDLSEHVLLSMTQDGIVLCMIWTGFEPDMVCNYKFMFDTDWFDECDGLKNSVNDIRNELIQNYTERIKRIRKTAEDKIKKIQNLMRIANNTINILPEVSI